LIVHFPRVSFLFFSIGASARVHSLILFEYHADGQFSLFFFLLSSQVRNCQFSERTFQFIQFRCLNG
jgi:hypothetical protein